MFGRFKYDDPRFREIADRYANLLFTRRGISDMKVAVISGSEEYTGASHQLTFVLCEKGQAEGAMRRLLDGAGDVYTEDFTRFPFVDGYLRDHSGLEIFTGCVVDQANHAVYVFFDGDTNQAVVRSLIGAIPAYFRYLFSGAHNAGFPLSEDEVTLACRIANPDCPFSDVEAFLSRMEVR